jgi:hypothetical protein
MSDKQRGIETGGGVEFEPHPQHMTTTHHIGHWRRGCVGDNHSRRVLRVHHRYVAKNNGVILGISGGFALCFRNLLLLGVRCCCKRLMWVLGLLVVDI